MKGQLGFNAANRRSTSAFTLDRLKLAYRAFCLPAGQYLAIEQALTRRPGVIINLLDFAPHPPLAFQPHDEFEKVDKQTSHGIDGIQLIDLRLGGVASVPDQMAHYRPILLLHPRIAIFLAGTAACEPEVLGFTIPMQLVVNCTV
ncbi:MAG: hypothetical protein M1132_12880 [Chloroflexi bacterium]|nr:hypothetical protein [Chloroflexota bacterium]